ncbi:glycosyltransferase family 9 protein [Aquabacterium sp. J223]|uniref:glycosyltransferase family 9 protein n=1 Tax=Aquabacterium sp. J223 TaxID=2898431 RepID=UPI0021AD80A5|nr:glycosyltransferase family 9 protein [Aquabacterium sp. J223]UUX97531.1 glycosyltransferase family 9 protein [Aquabacterium sp. J223]
MPPAPEPAATHFDVLPRFDGVRRIAVLRAGAVGDVVVALPALQSLRDAYPDAHLLLLARPWAHDFLRGRPGPVDEVLVLPAVPGVTAAPDADGCAADAVVAALQSRRLDLALQLHGGGRHSNPFVLRWGARHTVGLRSADAVPLERWLHHDDEPHPEALRLLECAALAGAPPAGLLPRLALRACDLDEATAVVPPDGRPLAVLNPGATDVRRRWPLAAFAEVGHALAARGLALAVNGGPDEAALTAQLTARLPAGTRDLAGRLSVGGLTALLARARLLLSNDTGPVHLAQAVGTPTVSVFWIGNLRSWGPTAVGRHRVAVSWRLHCPSCGLENVSQRCRHDDSFVADVTVDHVQRLVDALLAESGASPH